MQRPQPSYKRALVSGMVLGVMFAASVVLAAGPRVMAEFRPPTRLLFAREDGPRLMNVAREEAKAEEMAVVVETTRGQIVFQLFSNDAPRTVAHFLSLVKSGCYPRSSADAPMVFHRVVESFVIQTGDPTGSGYGGCGSPIPLEAKNRLTHQPGTVAMARGPDPNSARSQFYITLTLQPSLDGKYAIFGKVIRGMDVVRQIQMNDGVLSVRVVPLSTIEPEADRDDQKLKDRFRRVFQPSLKKRII
jgi:cyclophilin family peptidyl-prolyl cis-trans isomerase